MAQGCAPNDRKTKQKIEQLNQDLHGDQNLEDEVNSFMEGVNDKGLHCFL